jgi:hypothetical protein
MAMALYQDSRYVRATTHESFDKVFTPGSDTPLSGIYRCVGCGAEVASNRGNPLPPQNHHQHGSSQGSIRWQMVVFAEGKK